MRKHTKFMAVLSAAAVMAAAAPMIKNDTGIYRALAAGEGWVEEDGGWAYYDEDGNRETHTWRKRGSDWYYLDEDGEIAVSQRIDEYYVNAEGRMVKNQWVSAVDEDEYETPDSPLSGNWLYFGKDGKLVTSRWMNIGGKTYYFDDDGLMVTGVLELDGHTYYLGDENDGARKTGWILLEEVMEDTDEEDAWCYFDEDGRMVMDQMDRKIGDGYYTFIDGKMQTGWINVAEAGFVDAATAENAAESGESAAAAEDETPSLQDFRYYDEENGGRRASGWLTIEGVPGISEADEEYTFYFKAGVATHAKEGLELFNISSERYCFNEKGEMQTGIQRLPLKDGAEAVYYFNEEGVMQTGKQTIYDEDLEENQTWYFNVKGSQKGQGYHGVRDNQIYVNGLLQKADPELRYEAVSLGEKIYLINTSGNIQKASSSSTSSARPELGKGFKDIKDTNDTVWTVDSSGIIQ